MTANQKIAATVAVEYALIWPAAIACYFIHFAWAYLTIVQSDDTRELLLAWAGLLVPPLGSIFGAIHAVAALGVFQ